MSSPCAHQGARELSTGRREPARVDGAPTCLRRGDGKFSDRRASGRGVSAPDTAGSGGHRIRVGVMGWQYRKVFAKQQVSYIRLGPKKFYRRNRVLRSAFCFVKRNGLLRNAGGVPIGAPPQKRDGNQARPGLPLMPTSLGRLSLGAATVFLVRSHFATTSQIGSPLAPSATGAQPATL